MSSLPVAVKPLVDQHIHCPTPPFADYPFASSTTSLAGHERDTSSVYDAHPIASADWSHTYHMMSTTMDLINLPTDILREIVSYLHPPKLSKNELALFNTRITPPNAKRTSYNTVFAPCEAAETIDLSCFQLMRTCKALRNEMLTLLWGTYAPALSTTGLEELMFKTMNQEKDAVYWQSIAESTRDERVESKEYDAKNLHTPSWYGRCASLHLTAKRAITRQIIRMAEAELDELRRWNDAFDQLLRPIDV